MHRLHGALAAAVLVLSACGPVPANPPAALAPAAEVATAPHYGLTAFRDRGQDGTWDRELDATRDRRGDRSDAIDSLYGQAITTLNVRASGSQPGFGPERAIDGSRDTEWASEGFQTGRAELNLDLGRVINVGKIRLKTGPAKGSYYRAYLSSNGRDYQPASGRIEFSDWDVHDVTINGTGRHLRLVWRDPARQINHAAIFTLRVFERQDRIGRRPDNRVPRRGDRR